MPAIGVDAAFAGTQHGRRAIAYVEATTCFAPTSLALADARSAECRCLSIGFTADIAHAAVMVAMIKAAPFGRRVSCGHLQ